jgi:hypothetical protein
MSSFALWTAYRSMRMDSWGPQRIFGGIQNRIDESIGEHLQQFMADLATRNIIPGRLQPGERYEVNDAAEAALLLHLDHEISLIHGSPTVYRGQADHPGWTIQATIDRTREAGDERKHLVQIYGTMLFNFIISQIDWQAIEWMPKGWRLDEYPVMAMARHHGMATALIDVTVDPSVAVMFAHDQARETSAAMAKVFRFPVDDLGNDVKFNVPPPPVLRSVRQHGAFFDSRLVDTSPVEPPLKQAAVVCFPASSSRISENGFLRDGEIVDLMHADALLDAVEKLVRRCMAQMPVGAFHEEYFENKSGLPQSLRQVGLFSLLMLAEEGLLKKEGDRFRYNPTVEVVVEWFGLVTDIIHALCGIHYLEGRIGIRTDLLERFVHDNFVVSQVYLYFFANIYRGTPLESLLPIVRIINARLSEMSNGTVGIRSPDFFVHP